MRIVRRILIGLLVFFLLLVIVASIVAYSYQDTVKKQLLSRLNKNFQTQFEPESISFDFYDWGRLNFTFYNLKVKSSNEGNTKNIAELDKVIFNFNLSDLFQGRYTIEKAKIKGGKINLDVNKLYKANYDSLFKSYFSQIKEDVNLDLTLIDLSQITVEYHNRKSKEIYSFFIDDLEVGLNNTNEYLEVLLNQGSFRNFQFQGDNQAILDQKEVSFEKSELKIFQSRRVQIKPTIIKISGSEFRLEGFYEDFPNKADEIDLTLEGKNSDLKTILTFLPENIYEQLSSYKSEGKVDFEGIIRGSWGKKVFPNIDFDFGCQNVIITSAHDVSQKVTLKSFSGELSNGSKNNLSTTSLRLKYLNGSLARKRFKGSLSILNFKDPYVNAQIDAGIDLAAFQDFYPLENLEKLKGLLGIKLNFDGKLSDLKDEVASELTQVSGSLNLLNFSFKLQDNPLSFDNLNIRLDLSNNQSLIKEFVGKIGKSDFEIKGNLKNLLAYLFFKKSHLYLEGKFISQQLDVDQLLKSYGKGFAKESDLEKNDYTIFIPSNLQFDLDCQINNINFRKFKSRNLTYSIQLKNKELKISNLEADLASGKVYLLGILQAQKSREMSFDGRMILDNTNVSEVLKSFENFKQRFIRDRNITGRLSADIRYSIGFDQHLRINSKTVKADIDAQITQGKIAGFEPIERIDTRLQKNGAIANPSFEEIKTIIQIRNKNIYVSELDLHNVGNTHRFSAIGRFTIDDGLEYKIRTTVKPSEINPLAVNSYTTDANGFATFYLSLLGDVENPKIKFTYSSKQKIEKETLSKNWEKEKRVYLNLFKINSLSDKKFELPNVTITNLL